MRRDAAAVGHDVGVLLLVPAALTLASLPVAALAGDRRAALALAAVGLPTAGVGGALARRFRRARTEHRWPVIEVVALGWLLAGLVAALVLYLLGTWAPAGTADVAFRDPVNALFEGMSGITSTGLTVVGGREADLTATAQWWRSALQWTGGVGMVLFALAFGRSATRTRALYEAEGRHPDLPGGTRGTVRRTAALYLALTAAAVLALAGTGRGAWEALNHGLTGMATGGFTITGESLAGGPRAAQTVALLVIVVGSMAFVAHHVLLVQGDVRRWWRLTPVRAQAAVLVGGTALLVGLRAATGDRVAVFDTVFQWVSGAATAGFSTDPQLARWSGPALTLLTLAMVVGAPSGSTGGGLKLDRAVWLLKEAAHRARGRRGPLTWDRTTVGPAQSATMVRHATLLALLWAATLALGTIVVATQTGAALGTVAFDVASAQSNVGLDAGVVGPQLPGTAKATFVVLMYLGRLELLGALVLATQRERA